MKIIRPMSLLLISALSITLLFSCSSDESIDYDKLEINFFSDDFSWDFTPQEAYNYIKEHQLVSEEISVDTKYDDTTISDSMYIFKFDSNDKMEFVKYNMGQDTSVLNTIKGWYGDYDEMIEIAPGEVGYVWYGKMAGKNTEMALTISEVPDLRIRLEFVLK